MPALHEELCSKLAEALVARGWRRVESRDPNTLEAALATPPVVGSTLSMGRYRKAASDGFAATAWLLQECEFERNGRYPALRQELPLRATAWVGVTHPATEDLLRALDRGPVNLTLEWPLEELTTDEGCSAEVSAGEDVAAAAERLAGLVDLWGSRVAEERANVESFVAELRSDPDAYEEEREQVPALLATTNRSDEARTALVVYRTAATGDPQADDDYQGFADRLQQHLADRDGR